MNGFPTFQRLNNKILEEHQQIHFFLDQLQNSLDDLVAHPHGVEPLRRLAAQIDSLRERLEEHFEAEERGGLFQAILDLLPDAGPEIHRLGAEHDRMIEILQMARIHAQRGEAEDAGPLRADLQTLLHTIREHEKAEETLLRRAIEEESRSVG